ncbi:MAG: hypothetical protein ACI93R_002015 [Flavobacteriales bacterium]|jgi:uncharacterized protein YcgL (UPF0745 family)
MKIDIYTSSTNGQKYLSVSKGVKIEEIELPKDFDTELLSLSPLRTRLELSTDKEHANLDQVDILKQIEENGFAVHGVKNALRLSIED